MNRATGSHESGRGEDGMEEELQRRGTFGGTEVKGRELVSKMSAYANLCFRAFVPNGHSFQMPFSGPVLSASIPLSSATSVCSGLYFINFL